MKLKTIIIEDEINAREEMEFLLNETETVDVLEKCSNALEGIKAINHYHPDVVFLDIHMPGINGFEMLSMIDDSVMPRVVFVTAYDKYALKAFEKDAIDFLLKPIEKDRLNKTIEKLRRTIAPNLPETFEFPPLQRIPSVGNHKVKLVNIELIEFIKSDETGVYFYTKDNKHFTDLTLKVLENRTKLFRCHKQHLINLEMIDELIFEDNSSAKIKTTGQYIVPVSRHYLKDLKKQLAI